MSQSLELNIKTTSDVPQAMDKAKSATVSFGKQVEDIQKKFSTSFKDIFLSFFGPMALLTGTIALIGKLIADNQKKQQEANQAAIDGTNELMSAEDRYYANKLNNEKKAKDTFEEAAVARAKVTQDFFENDPRGRQMYDEAYREKFFGHPFHKTKPGLIKDDPEIQARVQAIIAEDIKKNPSLGAKPESAKDKTFKGPEGFGNVIGVGPNPVMEAMAAQLEEQKKQTALLEKIAGDPGATSWMNSNPSRATMLTGK